MLEQSTFQPQFLSIAFILNRNYPNECHYLVLLSLFFLINSWHSDNSITLFGSCFFPIIIHINNYFHLRLIINSLVGSYPLAVLHSIFCAYVETDLKFKMASPLTAMFSETRREKSLAPGSSMKNFSINSITP